MMLFDLKNVFDLMAQAHHFYVFVKICYLAKRCTRPKITFRPSNIVPKVKTAQ